MYHASTPDGSDLAIKIYKTSILVFKDRDRQAAGLLQSLSSHHEPRGLTPVEARTHAHEQSNVIGCIQKGAYDTGIHISMLTGACTGQYALISTHVLVNNQHAPV